MIQRSSMTTIALISISDVVASIEAEYRKRAVEEPINTSFLTDYSKVRPKLRGKLINTEMNRDFLETVPHRAFLELSLVYLVSVPKEMLGCHGTVQVLNNHMDMWGVAEQELYEVFMGNIESNDDAVLKDIDDILAELIAAEIDFDMESMKASPKLYAAGTNRWLDGAVETLNGRFLKKSSDYFGEDFFILPSSIHQLLFLPVSETDMDYDALADIVKEMNDTEIMEDEVLSNHVYYYSSKSGEVTIAA
ncbi:MAG: DUF5688 family protein [Lachnospiraceae bacterium]|nr:DUF5688 family protein [Lachnospiraceae bacterium]